METRRFCPRYIPRERGEILGRLGPLYGFPAICRDLREQQHASTVFFYEETALRTHFQPEPAGGHQWEVGYRGYPLKLWERRLRESGWSVISRDFTEHCRSVFHLL